MKMYCKKDNWILGAFYSKYVKQKLKKKKVCKTNKKVSSYEQENILECYCPNIYKKKKKRCIIVTLQYYV